MTRGRKPYYHDPLKTSITCEKFKYDLCQKLEHGPTAIFEAGLNWVIDKAIAEDDPRLTKEDIVVYQNLMNRRLNKAIREREEAELFTKGRVKAQPPPDSGNEEGTRPEETGTRAINEFTDNVIKLHKLLDPIFGKDECMILDRALDNWGGDETQYYRGIIQTASSKLACMRDFNLEPCATIEDILDLQNMPDLQHVMWRWLQDRVGG